MDVPTRWMDNDVYGHVNNVTYYSYFDTVINCYLINKAELDIHKASIIGVAVETMCRFHRAFAYPDLIQAGLSVSHIGRSSVRYQLALFGEAEDKARAQGHFVHVFVDRTTNVSTQIPGSILAALRQIKC